MAPTQSPQCQPGAAGQAVLGHRLEGILGTGGVEAARRRQQRRNPALVQSQARHHAAGGRPGNHVASQRLRRPPLGAAGVRLILAVRHMEPCEQPLAESTPDPSFVVPRSPRREPPRADAGEPDCARPLSRSACPPTPRGAPRPARPVPASMRAPRAVGRRNARRGLKRGGNPRSGAAASPAGADGQPNAAFLAASLQHPPAVRCAHAAQKTVNPLAASPLGLICLLHDPRPPAPDPCALASSGPFTPPKPSMNSPAPTLREV
jgi:hypothetical protein